MKWKIREPVQFSPSRHADGANFFKSGAGGEQFFHPSRHNFLPELDCKWLSWADRPSIFLAGWATKVPPSKVFFLCSKSLHSTWHVEKFLAIFDGFMYLDNSMGETSAAHPLVNSQSCYARVFKWAIRENIRQVELAQYGKIPYWASSTGSIFSCTSQLRNLVWQLLRFTRKYTLSRRIYHSIAFRYSIVRWLRMIHGFKYEVNIWYSLRQKP